MKSIVGPDFYTFSEWRPLSGKAAQYRIRGASPKTLRRDKTKATFASKLIVHPHWSIATKNLGNIHKDRKNQCLGHRFSVLLTTRGHAYDYGSYVWPTREIELNDGNRTRFGKGTKKELSKTFLIGNFFYATSDCHIPISTARHVENHTC